MNKDAGVIPRLVGLGQITEHLFIGNSKAANDTAIVSDFKITCIINATKDVENTPFPGVEYVRVSVVDSPLSPLSDHFDAVADKIRQIEEKRGRTLVHCNAGVSRSASLCLAYLIRYRTMTLVDAHCWVKARRPIVRPNIGFWKQLIDYEHKVHGCCTVRIIMSPIGEIPDLYEKETRDMIPC